MWILGCLVDRKFARKQKMYRCSGTARFFFPPSFLTAVPVRSGKRGPQLSRLMKATTCSSLKANLCFLAPSSSSSAHTICRKIRVHVTHTTKKIYTYIAAQIFPSMTSIQNNTALSLFFFSKFLYMFHLELYTSYNSAK